jgi:hypothetical protein
VLGQLGEGHVVPAREGVVGGDDRHERLLPQHVVLQGRLGHRGEQRAEREVGVALAQRGGKERCRRLHELDRHARVQLAELHQEVGSECGADRRVPAEPHPAAQVTDHVLDRRGARLEVLDHPPRVLEVGDTRVREPYGARLAVEELGAQVPFEVRDVAADARLAAERVLGGRREPAEVDNAQVAREPLEPVVVDPAGLRVHGGGRTVLARRRGWKHRRCQCRNMVGEAARMPATAWSDA